jgi:hypothetical protein
MADMQNQMQQKSQTFTAGSPLLHEKCTVHYKTVCNMTIITVTIILRYAVIFGALYL